MPIQDITDTAFITAYARAMETLQEDALFHDYHALALAGAARFVKALQRRLDTRLPHE